MGVLLACIAFAGWSGSASAHPLGNFTVNRYARIEVSAGRIRVYYVLDEAEIPAFQDRGALNSDRSGFLRSRVDEIARNLSLAIDGSKLTLRSEARSLNMPPGQGGLNTLRVGAIYSAVLPSARPDQRYQLRFTDRNQPERIGWREIVTVARGDARIISSNAPDRDVSDELRRYPGNLIQSPLDLRTATVEFTPGSKPAEALPVPASAGAPVRSGGSFANLITRQHLNPVALAGMYGLALLVGAGHAILPGHGKTVMAAYLVGTKGRPVDAVLLGVIVSLMHTFSVLALGLILFKVSRSVSVERIYPQLTAVSGVLAMAFGGWLFASRARVIRRSQAAARGRRKSSGDHQHDGPGVSGDVPDPVHGPNTPLVAVASAQEAHNVGQHDHSSHAHNSDDHHHDHGPFGHSHGAGGHTHELPEDVAPLSRRGLVVLATSGGIVPSPSAVIVVVSAFSIGRIVLGLSLIVAFSVGLALTLTLIGLTLVFGRTLIERRWPNRSLRYLPLAGATALIVAGAILALRGLTSIT
jgi:nickel/cobalt exporter